MKTILQIQNLKCGGCANTIIRKIGNLEFVRNLEVDTDHDTLSFEPLPLEDLTVIKRQLSIMGYPVIEDSNSLVKKAASYVSCAMGKIQM